MGTGGHLASADSTCTRQETVTHGIPGHEARVAGVVGGGRAREQEMRLERQVGAKR